MKGFKNAKVYVDGEGVKYADIAIENGKIVNIGTGLNISEPFEIPQNAVVCPAFIDEHVHGAAGADAMDGNVPALRKIAVALAKEGTANFIATTMTQSKENITAALSAVKRYMAKPHGKGAKVLGVHLEGPFISAKHVGAQPVEYLAEPDVKVFRKYYAASGKHIKLVTLAPEEPHSLNLIKYLAKNGITASAGHTDAGVKEIETAKKCGLSCVTHTYNAQRGVHHREIGVAGSALLFDDLYSEVICDLIHVSGPAIRLLIKSKPKDKVVLITDAMRAKGLKDGVSELGGQTVIVKHGEARLENGALAGSVLKMNIAVKNLVTACGVPFTDAIDYASKNPANNLNIFDRTGSIKVGKAADITVLDDKFNVLLTLSDGNVVYKRR